MSQHITGGNGWQLESVSNIDVSLNLCLVRSCFVSVNLIPFLLQAGGAEVHGDAEPPKEAEASHINMTTNSKPYIANPYL